MSESILFWLGEQRRPLKKDRSTDLVMDSVINYYSSTEPKLAYTVSKLFLDNGAYTAAIKGLNLKIEKVISTQEALKPDLTIPLDHPFRPKMTLSAMRKNWMKTRDNILFWQSSTSLSNKLVLPLHAWNKQSLIKNINWLEKKGDADYLAIGSVVTPTFNNYTGFFGDRQPRRELIDMLALSIENIKKYSDFKIHLMGFGSSPLMIHLAYYLGAESTDSAGFRRKAAFGKIILPGTGEKYAGNTSAKFGLTKLSNQDLLVLRNCRCPICRVNQDQLWIDWKARAIHNEYVIKNEVNRAETLLTAGIDAYDAYLDKIFEKSSLNYLWQFTKLRKKFHRISNVLFKGDY